MQTASTKRPSTQYTKPTTLDEITSETSPGGSNSGAMSSDVMIAIISCGIVVFAILALVIVIKRKRSSPPIYQNSPAYLPAYLHGPLPDQPVAPHAQGIPLQQQQQAHNRRSDESTSSHAYEEVNESLTCARTGALTDTLNDQAHPNIACHPHPGHSEANSSQPEHHSSDQDASAQHGCRAKDQAQPPPVTACSDLQAENKATNTPEAYEDEGYIPPDPAFAAGNAMHTLYENTAL
ncbi:hypothetical protein V1264_017428 [Littorina saxatilis]|uniref:Uncharacterized protein n=2 Tax=Littorina saxatilis TaxID=31220 RepID=A0AAN9BH64_9CAEN